MIIEAFDQDNNKIVKIEGDIHTFTIFCCNEPMKLKAPIKVSDNPLIIANIYECLKCKKYKKEVIQVIK